MDTKSTGIGLVCLTLLATIFCLALYPGLSTVMATHGNAVGQVGGFAMKSCNVFLFPLVLGFLFLIWLLIPAIEPLKKNLRAFRSSYNGFWLVLSVFVFYTFTLTIGQNTGSEFNFIQAFAPAIALLFAAVAVLLGHTKRNYFIGVRTPWTLTSDRVWNRTNVLASHLFNFCAVWALAGVIYPEYFVLYTCVPLMLTVIVTVVYSYIEYKREQV